MMHFYKSSIIMATVAFVAFVSVPPSYAFNIKDGLQAEGESGDISNRKLQRAAFLEARAYICGTDSEAGNVAMKAGMQETGLPEDIAVEVVSDLASGIIDQAVKTGSKKICEKAEVQMSSF